MPTPSVTFFSKYAGYQIIMVHATQTIVGSTVVKTSDKFVKFEHGRLDTQDPDVIAFLKGHKAYGRDFYASDDIASTPAPVTPKTAELPEVAKPVRTRKGERATVPARPTTAADLDDAA